MSGILCCLLPPAAESEAVQSWVRTREVEREEGREGESEGGREGRGGAELFAAAQQLQPQRDSLVPLPGQQADVAGEERRLEDVCFVDVVVAVSREDLQTRNVTSQACPAPWTAASPSHPPQATPPYLVRPGFWVLDDGPGSAVLAVRHLEGADELHAAEVFGTLSDDARDLLGRLQVHLRTEDRSCCGFS